MVNGAVPELFVEGQRQGGQFSQLEHHTADGNGIPFLSSEFVPIGSPSKMAHAKTRFSTLLGHGLTLPLGYTLLGVFFSSFRPDFVVH